MHLQTDRLSLREFTPTDWKATLAYQTAPGYQRYSPEVGRTETDARAFIARFLKWQREEPRFRYQWAVTLLGDGALIGNCGIRKSEPDALDAEIGCELAPEFWGLGFAVELSRLLLRFGFTELGLHRIHASCVADNVASVRVLENVGMRQEGRIRQNVRIHDRWCDTILYGTLESEWKTRGSITAVDVIIRPAKPADRSWILPIAPRLHDFGPPPWRPVSVMDAAVTRAIEKALLVPVPGSIVFAAEDAASRPLGFINLETHTDYFTGEEHGHVSDLVVMATAEHRGVGKALMAAAEEWARGLGFRLLTLNVFGANHGARKLYDRLGYQNDTAKMVKVLDDGAAAQNAELS